MSKRLGGIIGCKYKTSSWHLNGFPYGSNSGSYLICTVYKFIIVDGGGEGRRVGRWQNFRRNCLDLAKNHFTFYEPFCFGFRQGF